MHPEPLLSVWAPEGLRRLERNAIEGVVVVQDDAEGSEVIVKRRTGPCFTAKELWREIVAAEGKAEGDGNDNVTLGTEADGRDARDEQKGRGEKGNVGSSSTSNGHGNGKGAGDPDIDLNAQAPVKGKEHGQNKSKDKSKPKDQLSPAIIARFGVLPKIEGELRNTNTKEEWDWAVEELKLKLKLKAGGGYGYGYDGEAV